MNPVLFHLLILWAIAAVLLGGLFFALSRGAPIQPVNRRGVFTFISASFGVVVGMTTFFAYLPSGKLDLKFGSGGKVVTSYDPGCEMPQALALVPPNRLVVSGTEVCYEEDSPSPVGTLAVYRR